MEGINWDLIIKAVCGIGVLIVAAYAPKLFGLLGKLGSIGQKIADGLDKAGNVTTQAEEAARKVEQFAVEVKAAVADGVITPEEKEAIMKLVQELVKEVSDVPVAVTEFVEFIRSLKG